VVRRAGEDLPDPEVTRYSHDLSTRSSQIVLPNGISVTQFYDYMGRVSSEVVKAPDNSLLTLAEHEYNLNGLRIRSVERVNKVDGSQAVTTTIYDYDPLGRLTLEQRVSTEAGQSWENQYTYDVAGNRVRLEIGGGSGGVVEYSYDDNDRLTEEDAYGIAPYTKSYGYNDSGAIVTVDETGTGVDARTYTYSLDGLLTEVRVVSGDGAEVIERLARYEYDAQGNLGLREESRIEDGTIVSSSITRLVIDAFSMSGFSAVLEERTVAGDVLRTFTLSSTIVSEATEGAGRKDFIYDAHGSLRMAGDELADLVDQFSYDAFGNATASAVSSGMRVGYNGELIDRLSGLIYLRDRWYDPSVGRFTRADSWEGDISAPLSLHKYAFGNQDPVNHIDPSGNNSLVELSTAMAIGILAIALPPMIGLSIAGAMAEKIDAHEVLEPNGIWQGGYISLGIGFGAGNVSIAKEVVVGQVSKKVAFLTNGSMNLHPLLAVPPIAGAAVLAAGVGASYLTLYAGAFLLGPAAIGPAGLTMLGGYIATVGTLGKVYSAVAAITGPPLAYKGLAVMGGYSRYWGAPEMNSILGFSLGVSGGASTMFIGGEASYSWSVNWGSHWEMDGFWSGASGFHVGAGLVSDPLPAGLATPFSVGLTWGDNISPHLGD
jgi:RHS repeat-associated protein